MKTSPITLLASVFSASLLGNQAIAQVKTSDHQESNRPNIVFIFTDQQNANALSAHGNPYLKTPNMDFLVKNGISFTNSYCTSPVCGPSRSSLITGRMPHETGLNYNDGSFIKPEIPNIGEILGKNGYETIWAGKWHLPESYPAKSKKEISIRGFKLLRFYSPDSTNWDLGANTDKPLADAVTDYIRDYENTKPLFLCVSFHNPHDICHVPRRPENYPNPDASVKLPSLPVNHAIDPDEPDIMRNSRVRDHYGDELLRSQNNDETRWRSYLWHYYRMTEAVDYEIGRVLQALRDKGMEENTLIIFSSDHGDGMAENKWAAKLSLHDGPARVPFVLYFKDKIEAKGVNKRQLVSGIDVVPTILDYANIEIPNDFKGISLMKAAKRNTKRDFIVTELAVDPKDHSLTGRMIRTERFKYNLYSKGEKREELFDMKNDPYEMKNLINKPEFKSIKEQLRSKLKNWLEETKDPFLNNWEI